MPDPVAPPAGAPVLSAHDQAMLAKVDQQHAAHQPPKEPAIEAAATPPAGPAVRPEHVPEKFWDAAKGVAKWDDMARAYAELERSKGAPATTPPVDPAAPPTGAPEGTPAGIDFETYSTEFATNGKLGEESYAALAAKGIPKAVVDQYIANQQLATTAASQAATGEAYAVAGGQEAYGSMLDWASANLSPADQAAFDRAVVGDAASRKQAVTALKARYEAARGSDPKLLSGDGQSDGAGAFQSRAEVTAAMRDPRYKADPAYRAMVERRIGAMAVF